MTNVIATFANKNGKYLKIKMNEKKYRELREWILDGEIEDIYGEYGGK